MDPVNIHLFIYLLNEHGHCWQ